MTVVVPNDGFKVCVVVVAVVGGRSVVVSFWSDPSSIRTVFLVSDTGRSRVGSVSCKCAEGVVLVVVVDDDDDIVAAQEAVSDSRMWFPLLSSRTGSGDAGVTSTGLDRGSVSVSVVVFMVLLVEVVLVVVRALRWRSIPTDASRMRSAVHGAIVVVVVVVVVTLDELLLLYWCGDDRQNNMDKAVVASRSWYSGDK